MSSEGALIIYHKRGTNEILLGNEGKYLWDTKPVPQEVLDAERVNTSPIDLKDYNKREDLTKEIVGKVDTLIKKQGIKFDWLVPPVKKSTNQKGATGGNVVYSTHTRIQSNNVFGAPKGGKEGNEYPLATIIREIKEEIGDIDNKLLPKDNNRNGRLTITNKYDVFLKTIFSDEAKIIEDEINRRKKINIGEMFNLEFRDFNDKNILLNDPTIEALEILSLIDKTKAEKMKEAARAAKATASGAATGAATGAASGAAPRRGGRRYTKKQRKHKKTKKHTRRR